MNTFLKNLILGCVLLAATVTSIRPSWSQIGAPQPAPQVEAQIAALQWKRAGAPVTDYADVGEGALYVLKGSLDFRVTKDNEALNWSPGFPEWTGVPPAAGVPTVGVPTLRVPFPTVSTSNTPAGFQVVTVKSSNGVDHHANLMVYSLGIDLKPNDEKDIFAGRSYDTYGLSETLKLQVLTNTAGLTADNIGPVSWDKSGNAVIANSPEGVANLFLFGVGQVDVALIPSNYGLGIAKTISAIAPNGVHIEKHPDTPPVALVCSP